MAVDTLAYQYTRPAPTITVPRKNVIIRLCSTSSLPLITAMATMAMHIPLVCASTTNFEVSLSETNWLSVAMVHVLMRVHMDMMI
eukprot:COSAG05_NODE_52_length_23775_cov_49.471110_15_plen_85_part_00